MTNLISVGSQSLKDSWHSLLVGRLATVTKLGGLNVDAKEANQLSCSLCNYTMKHAMQPCYSRPERSANILSTRLTPTR